MLERPGDLIPVQPNATSIPWTRRRSQILNFLHRGPVTFSTLVYDTNVGDISALATYFNPDRISERELNLRFGHYPSSGEKHASPQKAGTEAVVKPRLLLYPDHNLNSSQVKVQRTLNWVLSQDSSDSSPTVSGQTTPAEAVSGPVHQTAVQAARTERQASGADVRSAQSGLMGLRLTSSEFIPIGNPEAQELPSKFEDNPEKVGEAGHPLDTSLPPSTANLPCLVAPKSFTLPTVSLTNALDSMWAEKGVGAVDTLDSVWAEKGVNSGLGLGGLVNRVSKSTEVLDRLEGGERWWGAWDTAHTW
eukprot:GFUD01016842.1.p1 GENE.GFUD01016842.1~~GFUD01016842.1.p1  ORF type:complete len:305 (-),score=80.53 GFUD01016842.1:430-1344(-)